jgi:hypothetical protein
VIPDRRGEEGVLDEAELPGLREQGIEPLLGFPRWLQRHRAREKQHDGQGTLDHRIPGGYLRESRALRDMSAISPCGCSSITFWKSAFASAFLPYPR